LRIGEISVPYFWFGRSANAFARAIHLPQMVSIGLQFPLHFSVSYIELLAREVHWKHTKGLMERPPQKHDLWIREILLWIIKPSNLILNISSFHGCCWE
jgi:hypothetical protein